MHVEQYSADREIEWNEFVRESKNGTFLFDRAYMEYHRDRFSDASIVVRDDRGRLLALLPASQDGGALVSHGGLTYGGFVSAPKMTTRRMLAVFEATLDYFRHIGVDHVTYKCVPHIYHSLPAEEDGYALFVHNARLVRRDVSSAIDTRLPLPHRQGRVGVLRRAERAGLSVVETDEFHRFWPVLEETLERHAAKPVHTVDEITHLARRFPENIVLFVCTSGHEVLAGSVLYLSRNVCHVQYNGASAKGRQLGALDLVLHTVLQRFSASHRVIDFGISTERDGRQLNAGLIDYKEGFGARAVNYDAYDLRVS